MYHDINNISSMCQYSLKMATIVRCRCIYYQSISDFKVRILAVTHWAVTRSEYLHVIVSALFTAVCRIYYVIYFSQETGVIIAKCC